VGEAGSSGGAGYVRHVLGGGGWASVSGSVNAMWGAASVALWGISRHV
jgi:hypothetical protein